MARLKTQGEFDKEVYDMWGDEYTFLEPYVNTRTKIKVKHNVCGSVYKTIPANFLTGKRCPKCYGNASKKKTTKLFKKEVKERVGEEYSVLGEYVARDIPIKMKHNKCGRVYDVQPGNFLYKSRCIECYYDTLRLSVNEVDTRIKKFLGDDYVRVGAYVSMGTPLKIKHLICGRVKEYNLSDVFTQKTHCFCNNMSIGEQMVDEWLRKNKIEYQNQKTFDGLRNKAKMFYDFYLPSEKAVIEYHGEQHYKPKTFGGITKEGAVKRFNEQLYRDKLKKDFADENGLLYVEVPYTIKTAQGIDKELNRYNFGVRKAENLLPKQ